MSIYLPLSLHQFQPRRVVFSTWLDHMAFGYDIVAALKPKLSVELGTQNGLSYFTFCQSVADNHLDAVCYAVDTWAGDKHTDQYDDTVFEEVEQHNRRHYWGFSYLLRMRFVEAVHHFENNSIDLLHIDGLHTYDAVKADFETWYPKVKPGGIILFHDVLARIKDFGVWKFWQELEQEYPCFAFHQGFGLGVLFKPGGSLPNHTLINTLRNSDKKEQQHLRNLYIHVGRYLELQRTIGPNHFRNPTKKQQG